MDNPGPCTTCWKFLLPLLSLSFVTEVATRTYGLCQWSFSSGTLSLLFVVQLSSSWLTLKIFQEIYKFNETTSPRPMFELGTGAA